MTELLGVTDDKPAAEQANKVAAVTISFWIIKILATTAGDVCGDLLSITLGLGYILSLAVALGFVLAVVTAQLKASRFYPVLYWVLILASSTVGAEISDTLDRTLHLGYIAGSALLFACLLSTLTVWHARQGRIRIYPVYEGLEERFYWLAVIFANSLGSVLGDLIGDRLGLGLIGGISINATVIAVLVLLNYTTRLNKALLFWTAFVFTRA